MATTGVSLTASIVPLMNGEQQANDPQMKISRCLNFCRVRNYNYAGLTAGHTCQCAKWPSTSDPEQNLPPVDQADAVLTTFNRLPAARCMENHCVDDPIHACGGQSAVAVYDSKLHVL